MTGKPAASEADYPTYPEYREEFGLDPARFLYADMDVRPLLRGIDDIDLLRAFQTVEADRDEPDRELIGDIAQRIQSLQSLDTNASASSGAVATDGGVDR
jgi:hypothetical protein